MQSPAVDSDTRRDSDGGSVSDLIQSLGEGDSRKASQRVGNMIYRGKRDEHRAARKLRRPDFRFIAHGFSMNGMVAAAKAECSKPNSRAAKMEAVARESLRRGGSWIVMRPSRPGVVISISDLGFAAWHPCVGDSPPSFDSEAPARHNTSSPRGSRPVARFRATSWPSSGRWILGPWHRSYRAPDSSAGS
jgi:hypothetical protein